MRLATPLATALVAAAIAAPALAEDGSCWLREYSADHLAQHPEQGVVSLEVVFFKDPWGNDVAHATAHFRGDPEPYWNVLSCYPGQAGDPKGAVTCAVECDGGAFTAWTANDGALRLRTTGFIVQGGCGEGEDLPIRTVSDDPPGKETVFRLPAVSAARCEERIGELNQ